MGFVGKISWNCGDLGMCERAIFFDWFSQRERESFSLADQARNFLYDFPGEENLGKRQRSW